MMLRVGARRVLARTAVRGSSQTGVQHRTMTNDSSSPPGQSLLDQMIDNSRSGKASPTAGSGKPLHELLSAGSLFGKTKAETAAKEQEATTAQGVDPNDPDYDPRSGKLPTFLGETASLPRERKLDQFGRAHGQGRRKDAVASAWIAPGTGNMAVNKMPHVHYFKRMDHRFELLKPFIAVDRLGEFDMYCEVHGGGISGQAGAARLAIARALQNYNPEKWRKPLKDEKLLLRDPRVVERKKFGRKKARKGFTWVKR